MNAKGILVSGIFTEEDWKELLQTMRLIESRHPTVNYNAVVTDNNLNMDEALAMMRRTFPEKEGETPLFHTVKDPIERWVDDYRQDDLYPVGQAAALAAMDVFLADLRQNLNLKQTAEDVGRTVEILKAFQGKLTITDWQVNGMPEEDED